MKNTIKITIDELKQESIKILQEIQRICLHYNLKFFLAYGTLLGAIRHKGFIPWDDDVDIWMPRKDYEQFIEIFNNSSSDNYRLMSWHTDDKYPFLVAKVVYTDTYVEEKCFKPLKGLGVWVDIFPLDYVSEEKERVAREQQILEHKRWISLYRQSTFGAKLKLFFYNLIQADTTWSDRKLLPSELMKQIYSLSNNSTKSDLLVCPGGEKEFSQYFDKADFEETIEANFEGLKFPIPAGYESILKTLYGDYMKLPPVAKQKMDKHLKKAIWLNK